MDIVILGCAYTGSYLLERLLLEGYRVYASSRNPDKSKYLQAYKKRIRFDLNDSSSYSNIPDKSSLIWLFPAEPVEQVKAFYEYLSKHDVHVRIVFGTTSSYISTGLIDENTPLDLSKERVKGENFLMEHGAVVFQTAGLYGYEKHPFNWLNRELIKNSNKSVNLIHVNDICNAVVKVLKSEIKSERINLSDGEKYLWKDLWELGRKRNMLFTDCPPALKKEGKYVSNAKLRKILGADYQFEEI